MFMMYVMRLKLRMTCTHHYELFDEDDEKVIYNCIVCGKKSKQYKEEEVEA